MDFPSYQEKEKNKNNEQGGPNLARIGPQTVQTRPWSRPHSDFAQKPLAIQISNEESMTLFSVSLTFTLYPFPFYFFTGLGP
jgi:hypothetical protein